MTGEPSLRLLDSSDSIAELTALLHRAYEPLAAAGMRFLASHQDEEATRRRCREGECWVARDGDRLVGTITWRAGGHGDVPAHYLIPGVAVFGQFAVEPVLQGRGVGGLLLDRAERCAAAAGFTQMACDTSSQAEQLVAHYARRGYMLLCRHRWSVTNYESVVLSKRIGAQLR